MGECRCPSPSALASISRCPARYFSASVINPGGVQPPSLGFIQTGPKAAALGPCNNNLTVLTSCCPEAGCLPLLLPQRPRKRTGNLLSSEALSAEVDPRSPRHRGRAFRGQSTPCWLALSPCPSPSSCDLQLCWSGRAGLFDLGAWPPPPGAPLTSIIPIRHPSQSWTPASKLLSVW